MDAEQLDGLLVALRSMAVANAPAGLVDAIGRVQALHARAAHHGIDLAMARIEDGSGISEAAALPMTGRSKKEHLSGGTTQTGFLLGFAASGHDLAVLMASGVDIVACAAPWPIRKTSPTGYRVRRKTSRPNSGALASTASTCWNENTSVR